MSWTDGKISMLRKLWRSNWSAPAVAAALGMTIEAVETRLRKLRREEDVYILLGDLAREVFALQSLPPIGVRDAHRLLKQPAFLEGIERGIA